MPHRRDAKYAAKPVQECLLTNLRWQLAHQPGPDPCVHVGERDEVIGYLLIGMRGNHGVDYCAAEMHRQYHLEPGLSFLMPLSDRPHVGLRSGFAFEGTEALGLVTAFTVRTDMAGAGSKNRRTHRLEMVDRHEAK